MKAQVFIPPRVSCLCATEVGNTIHLHICWASCPQVFAVSWRWHLCHRTRFFSFYSSSYHPRYRLQELLHILWVWVCAHTRAVCECDQRIGLLANKASISEKGHIRQCKLPSQGKFTCPKYLMLFNLLHPHVLPTFSKTIKLPKPSFPTVNYSYVSRQETDCSY